MNNNEQSGDVQKNNIMIVKCKEIRNIQILVKKKHLHSVG